MMSVCASHHCPGQKLTPSIIEFKLLSMAAEIFWHLIQVLLLRFASCNSQRCHHCRMWIRNYKRRWASGVRRMPEFTFWLIVSSLPHFSGCVWCFCCVISALSDTSSPTLFGICDASLLFFLICVQYTGRLVFACELLFCCLWCGAR